MRTHCHPIDAWYIGQLMSYLDGKRISVEEAIRERGISGY